jgi:integrase
MPKQKRHDRRLRWGDGWVEERVIGDQQTRYVARWPELRSDGRRRWRGKTFGSLAAAETHLRDVADKMISGRYVAPSDATVEGIVREWFDRGISGWKGSTITTYRMLITRMIVGYLGKTRAVDMTLGKAQQWIDQLGKAKLSPRTIRLAVRLVVGAFDDAIRFGIVTVNPIRGVKLPPLIDAPMQTWDDVDVRRVFTKIRTEPMWFALYRLAIATGIRPGELRVCAGQTSISRRAP